MKVAERDRHLENLESYSPGFTAAWDSWRASLSSTKRWTAWSEVLKLRKFVTLAERYDPAEILDMATLAAERNWQGFEERWWIEERSKDRKKPAAKPAPDRGPIWRPGDGLPNGDIMGEDGQWHRPERPKDLLS